MHQTVQATADGHTLIKNALKAKKWSWDVNKNDQPLIEASKLLEPDKEWPRLALSGTYAKGVNEASWGRFLKGDKVEIYIFAAYCLALDLKWECVTDLDQIDPQLPLELPRLPTSINQAQRDTSEFIQDVTIPEGSMFKPNQKFVKIWEIRNSGNIAWKNRYLRRIGAHEGAGFLLSPKRVRIANTLPGQNVQIKVEMQAPEAGGTYRASWKMIFADGTLCYPNKYRYGLFVTIIVIQ